MIVFLHIPKTAGSTFQFILENTFGLSACATNHTKKPIFRQDDFVFANFFFPKMKSLAGHNLLNPLALNLSDPFHMTFLREPVARIFSHYQDRLLATGKTQTFEEFMRQNAGAENLHVKLMAGERNLDKAKRYLERCDFVGLTEKFDLSLHMLGKLSPNPLNLRYLRRRTATTNAIRKPLASNSHMIELARERNQLDLALYDFATQEIFPKLCAKAGFTPDSKVASLDTYTNDRHLRYRLCHLYNLLIYRQFGKLRRRPRSATDSVQFQWAMAGSEGAAIVPPNADSAGGGERDKCRKTSG
jgi:Sulfotransferase family